MEQSVNLPVESKQRADLRDYLAAERTFLAWVRTGLALMGFGFVVARFGLFLQQLQVLPSAQKFSSTGLSLWFGTALIAAGVIVNLFSARRHVLLIRELDKGDDSFPRSLAQTLSPALFLALVGLAMAIYLVSVHDSTSFIRGIIFKVLGRNRWALQQAGALSTRQAIIP